MDAALDFQHFEDSSQAQDKQFDSFLRSFMLVNFALFVTPRPYFYDMLRAPFHGNLEFVIDCDDYSLVSPTI